MINSDHEIEMGSSSIYNQNTVAQVNSNNVKFADDFKKGKKVSKSQQSRLGDGSQFGQVYSI